jgi:hypothetical protein
MRGVRVEEGDERMNGLQQRGVASQSNPMKFLEDSVPGELVSSKS